MSDPRHPNPTPPEDAPPPPDHHNPHASSVEKTLSKMAVAALVTAVVGLAADLVIARVVLIGGTAAPAHWVEFIYPLIPLVGILLSMNALLRTADPMERLSGDSLAWL